MDFDKRTKNVRQMLNSFMLYFLYHGLFFLVFSGQNYYFYDEERFQYCFGILILFYATFVIDHVVQLRNKKQMRLYGKWLKPRLYLKIIEHILMAISMALIPFYLQQKPLINVPGWLLLVPPILSGLINLFLVKYEQTPCNATFQLTVKTVLVIRLLVGANIIIREEAELNWDWSTTFWPYWCSFTIQAVLVIATVVIFLNTLSSYFKNEAKMHDVLGSLWGLLMAAGFMLSTLQPVIVIIKIFDVAKSIPDKFFDVDFPDKERLETELRWMSQSEQYAYEMLTQRKHEIAFLISQYPLIYCFGALLITCLLRNQIGQWFEIILYSDEDEEQAERRRRRRLGQPNNAEQEFTVSSGEEEAGAQNGEEAG